MLKDIYNWIHMLFYLFVIVTTAKACAVVETLALRTVKLDEACKTYNEKGTSLKTIYDYEFLTIFVGGKSK